MAKQELLATSTSWVRVSNDHFYHARTRCLPVLRGTTFNYERDHNNLALSYDKMLVNISREHGLVFLFCTSFMMWDFSSSKLTPICLSLLYFLSISICIWSVGSIELMSMESVTLVSCVGVWFQWPWYTMFQMKWSTRCQIQWRTWNVGALSCATMRSMKFILNLTLFNLYKLVVIWTPPFACHASGIIWFCSCFLYLIKRFIYIWLDQEKYTLSYQASNEYVSSK